MKERAELYKLNVILIWVLFVILAGGLFYQIVVPNSSNVSEASEKLSSVAQDSYNDDVSNPDYDKLSAFMSDYIDGEDVLDKTVVVHIQEVVHMGYPIKTRIKIGSDYSCVLDNEDVFPYLHEGNDVVIRVIKIKGNVLYGTYIGDFS